MKKIIYCFLAVLPLISFGQEFKLMTASSKMLFADAETTGSLNTFSLSIESAKQIGTDSVYYNFFGVNSDWIESDSCVFWGSSMCNQQNKPVWIGPKIDYDNIETYRFYNLNNDSLVFAFNTDIDGPIQFFRDSIQQFNMMFVGDDTLTVLGVMDTVRSFTISHMDLEGNTIDSPLNGYQIMISKTFGLKQFFVIDSFPQVLKPLYLIGSANPAAGLYQLTNEMVYDYQPGDELQFLESSWYQPPAPPWYYYTRYRKWFFLERNQTSDSLSYLIRQELFYEDSVGIAIDTIWKRYLRSAVIAEIPFEKFDGSVNELKLVDYCGENRWTFSRHTTEGAVYCEPDTCWGQGDTFGPPEEWHTTYVAGLGIHTYNYSMDFEYGFDIQKKIVYFKKNGIECGGQIYVGVDKTAKHDISFEIIPNPASNQIHVSSTMPMKQVTITDLLSNFHFSQKLSVFKTQINIHHLKNGLYFVSAQLDNGTVVTKKLLISKR